MNKKILGWGVVGVLLVAGLIFPRGNSVVQQIVGANPGPESSSPYNSFNGISYWYNRTAIRTATSTLCSIKSPAATSTLVSADAFFTSGAAYDTTYSMGWDSTAYSTTTALGTTGFTVGANAKSVVLVATTTTAIGGTAQSGVIPPSSFINLKLSTSTAGASATYAPAGFCSAVFKQL